MSRIWYHPTFKRFIGSFGTYTTGNILDRALPFLMLPILTRWLSTADYGVIGTFGVVQAQVALAVTMAIPGAVGRAWFDRGNGPGDVDLPVYIFNGLLVNTVLFFVVGAIFFMLSGFIATELHLVGTLLWIIWITAFLIAIHSIKAKLWRCQERPLPFTIYQVLRTFLNFAFSIGLLYFLWMDWRGRIGGLVLAETLTAAVCLFLLIREDGIRIKFRRDYVTEILKFGLPLYPHALGMLIITGADKFLLNSLEGLSTLGVYNVAFSIGAMVTFMASSIDTSLMPWMYRKLKAPTISEQKQIVLATYGCVVLYVGIALLLGIVAAPLLGLFVGKAFHGAADYVMILSLAHAAAAAYRIFTFPIFYAKKTHVLAWITFFSGIVTLFADYLLIVRYGTIGAAWGTLIGFSTLCLGAWYYAHKIQPLPWLRIFFKPKTTS